MLEQFMSERAKAFKKRLILTAKGKRGARTMTRQEAKEALSFLFTYESNDIQKTAFLISMRFKGAESEELAGFSDAIKEKSIPVNHNLTNLLDSSCPYDGRAKTLNLSVASSIVASAAGVPVLTHSATSLPPKKGITAAEILEALGIPAFLSPVEVEKRLESTGFAFIHSSKFAPHLDMFRHIRETLGNRSFLQNCEILNNPGNAKTRLMGVAHSHFLNKLVQAALTEEMDHCIAIEGVEGSDELPLKKSTAAEYRDKKITSLEIDPQEYGLTLKEPEPLKSPKQTAEIIHNSFSGSTDKHNDTIYLNAGVRIYLGGKAKTLHGSVNMARDVMTSKEALNHLEKIRGYM